MELELGNQSRSRITRTGSKAYKAPETGVGVHKEGTTKSRNKGKSSTSICI
jgi:hypothetical protein